MNINGNTEKIKLDVATSCDDKKFFNYQQIHLPIDFIYSDHSLNDLISFEQTAVWTYIHGFVSSIAGRVTRVKSCKIGGKACECKILGDGQ